MFARVGWEAKAGEGDPTANLRMQLIGVLADLGDQSVINEARRRFAAQKTDPNAMPVALRKTITGVVAEHADKATWDTLHAQAKAETTAADQGPAVQHAGAAPRTTPWRSRRWTWP